LLLLLLLLLLVVVIIIIIVVVIIVILNYPRRACQFNRTQLGDCSGIGDPTHYGYSTGQPCVFIKMNRVPMILVSRGGWRRELGPPSVY